MKKERAEYILNNLLPFGGIKYSFIGKRGASETQGISEDGLTPEEVEEIHEVWNKMSGNSSFTSALTAIARGDAEFQDCFDCGDKVMKLELVSARFERELKICRNCEEQRDVEDDDRY